MTRIETSIEWAVPVAAAFDAERDISLHVSTQGHRAERAVAGVTAGLIGLGEEVEWEAVHFGLRQRMRVRVTHMDGPRFFRDEMIRGPFRSFAHEHHFSELRHGRTVKTDIVTFSAPFGPFGWAAERLFLAIYLRNFLDRKNAALKRLLEGDGGASGSVRGSGA